jgi:Flp pilus assembly protein TadB
MANKGARVPGATDIVAAFSLLSATVVLGVWTIATQGDLWGAVFAMTGLIGLYVYVGRLTKRRLKEER